MEFPSHFLAFPQYDVEAVLLQGIAMGTIAAVKRVHQLAALARLGAASDRELIANFAADRDANAFAAIVERHGPMILNLCRRLIGDTHLAEDAFQATFLILSRKASALKNPDALANWLYGTARRVALRAFHRLQQSRRPPSREVPAAVDPLSTISGRELIRLIETEIARLPEINRIPLILCTIEGLSINETARRTGSTPASVRNRLARARERLAKRLDRRGIALSSAMTALLAIPRTARANALRDAVVAAVEDGRTLSTSVVSLASGGILAGVRMKITMVAIVIAGMIGVGMAVLPAQTGAPSEQPAAPPAKIDSDTVVAHKPGTDQYGDALPEGAIARYGTLRFRNVDHGAFVFSPDGRYFAIGRRDLSLVDVQTGKVVRTFRTDTSIRQISFSPDGKRILVCNGGNTAESIWDVESGNKLQLIERSGGVLVRDGKAVIQVDWQGFDRSDLRLLDSGDGKKIAEYRFNRHVDKWAASPGGELVAICVDSTNRIYLVDVGKRDEVDLGEFTTSTGPIKGFVFSPDNRFLVVAGGKGVAVVDAKACKVVQSWPRRSDSPPVISPGGKRIAWSGYDNDLGIAYAWAVDVDGAKPWRVGAPTNNFTAPAFSHDGKMLAVLDDGEAIQFRDVVTGKEIRPQAAHGGRVGGVMFSPDDKYLISRDKNRILVWDKRTTRLIRRFPDDLPEGEALLNTVARTNRHLITVDAADVLRVRDIVTGKPVLQLDGKDGFIGGAANPAQVSVDGQSAAVVGNDGDVRVYDLTTGKVRFQFDPEAAVWSASLSGDGRYLQVSCQGRKKGENVILDTVSGKEVDRRKLPPSPPQRLIETSDGRMFPVGFDSLEWLGAQKFLDESGQPLKIGWNLVGGHIYAPANGRYVAIHYSLGRRGEINSDLGVRIRLWDFDTRKPLAHFNPTTPSAQHARFSPNGRLLAILEGGAVSVWEVASGQERVRFQGHSTYVSSLSFTPDGRGIVTGGEDTQVLLWDYTGRAPDGVWRMVRHDGERQRELWRLLAGDDAHAAHRAVWELAADPSGTVRFLNEKLRPAKKPAEALLVKSIEQLTSAIFAEREKATSELRTMGDVILPQLRVAFGKATDEEQRARLERIIREMEKPALASARIQQVRGIEVLEYIGTSESKDLLEKLAAGESTARLTREANFALGRK
jgi:RNA polymerase sigma factor (sigma-70 family)